MHIHSTASSSFPSPDSLLDGDVEPFLHERLAGDNDNGLHIDLGRYDRFHM